MLKKIFTICFIVILLFIFVGVYIYIQKNNILCNHNETYEDILEYGDCTHNNKLGIYCKKCNKLLETTNGDFNHTNLTLINESNHYCDSEHYYKYFQCKDCNKLIREKVLTKKTSHKFSEFIYSGTSLPHLSNIPLVYQWEEYRVCNVCGFIEYVTKYGSHTEAFGAYYKKFPSEYDGFKI